jgi:tRNA G18 (ribose-2'-O)-methylase SpoU
VSEVLSNDTRNVQDEFKGLPMEDILSELRKRRHPFATMCLNIDYDLNIATMVRNHNAFCGEEFFYIGRKRWNRQGAVGTYLYEQITRFEDLKEALTMIPAKYTWVGLDNRPGAIPISTFEWPAQPLFVFGHENSGLDFLPDLPYHCKDIVYIPQTGSVRSLNVGVASGIAMYDYCLKRGYLNGEILPERTPKGSRESTPA